MKGSAFRALICGLLQILTLHFSPAESKQDFTRETTLVTLKSYLNARDLTFKDVPQDIVSLITKYFNKIQNTDPPLDFIKLIKEDYKKSKHMLLEDEMNNEIFFDLLDYVSSNYEENPIEGASLDALIAKTMEKFPAPVELKFLETKDVMKYLLFIDSHPKVMNAVEDFVKDHYKNLTSKRIDDLLEPKMENIIVENVLKESNFNISEVDPELLELFKGFARRRLENKKSTSTIPNETDLNIMKTYQDILTSAVESVLNFLKSPDYIRDTDHWIDNILKRFQTILSIISLDDIIEFFDILFINEYDFKVLKTLHYQRKLVQIDNAVDTASSYLPLKSLEDIYIVSKAEILKSYENYSPFRFLIDVCGMEEADIVQLTEPKFLEVIDNVLRKHKLTVKKLSPELLHLVSKVFHRVEEQRNNSRDYKSETLANDLKTLRTTFTLIRNRFREIALPLEFVIDYRNLLETYKSTLMPIMRAAPPQEIIKLFNIILKDNKLMDLFARNQMERKYSKVFSASNKFSTWIKEKIAKMLNTLDAFAKKI